VRQLKVGKVRIYAAGSTATRLHPSAQRCRCGYVGNRNEIGSVNRNAVAPVLKAGVFHLRLYAAGHNPFRVGKIVASGSQGSRNGNLGLEDGTALRLERQISVTYFQLAHWTGIKSLTEPAAED